LAKNAKCGFIQAGIVARLEFYKVIRSWYDHILLEGHALPLQGRHFICNVMANWRNGDGANGVPDPTHISSRVFERKE